MDEYRFVLAFYDGCHVTVPLFLTLPKASKVNVCNHGAPQFAVVIRARSSYPYVHVWVFPVLNGSTMPSCFNVPLAFHVNDPTTSCADVPTVNPYPVMRPVPGSWLKVSKSP